MKSISTRAFQGSFSLVFSFSALFFAFGQNALAQCQHDTPCDALPMTIGSANAVQLSNVGCTSQTNETVPPQGNCQAAGYWCDGGATKSVWTKFQVPDGGAYEITTCHNGTSFDTQIACYISTGCYYTLNGYDSFGDGWNGGFVTITIDGVSTNYGVQAYFNTWLIPVGDGQSLTLSWQPGGWPEECSFELIDINGTTVLNVPATPPTGVLFTTTTVCTGEVCNIGTFQMVSANDDSFEGCELPICIATVPECVITASAAYNNVIVNDPFCCDTAWDSTCQTAYDALIGSCTGGVSTNCEYTLNAYDSFGDGWEGGYLQIAVNGVPTDYVMTGGSFQTFQVPVVTGATISIMWTPGNHQDEASFQLLDSSGQEVVAVNAPMPVGTVLFNGTAFCVPQSGVNPNSSRAFVSCLEPGTTVWVQIDGHNNAAGSVVISVKPYVGPNNVEAFVTDVNCPGGFGVPGEGNIVPFINGWGTNYESNWTGPQGFSSNDSYITGLEPGNYTLNATDACGNHVSETFTVSGPSPFLFQNTITPTCPDQNMGSISVEPSGGTAPYNINWIGPNDFSGVGTSASNLGAGTYNMFLSDSHGCALMQVLQVNAVPLPVVNLGQDLTICQADNIMLTGPEASSYSWSTGGTEQSVNLSGSTLGVGTHVVSLIAANELGCTASDQMVITVQSCTGVEESAFDAFAFYPNPASDRLVIEGLPAMPTNVRLMTADGKMVWSEQTNGQSILVLDMSGFGSGLYVLEAANELGFSRGKVMVNH